MVSHDNYARSIEGCATPSKLWQLRLALLAVVAWPLSHACAEEEINSIFIVAKPGMQDPNFRETVVLVIRPGGEGPVGVVINRPTRLRLSEVFSSNKPLQQSADTLYVGGPVARTKLVFAFRSAAKPKQALPALQDVYVSQDPDLLAELLSRSEPTRDLRLYAGYAGWAPGQLEAEIERGDWFVMQADAEMIFSTDPDQVWPEFVKRASSRSVDAGTVCVAKLSATVCRVLISGW